MSLTSQVRAPTEDAWRYVNRSSWFRLYESFLRVVDSMILNTSNGCVSLRHTTWRKKAVWTWLCVFSKTQWITHKTGILTHLAENSWIYRVLVVCKRAVMDRSLQGKMWSLFLLNASSILLSEIGSWRIQGDRLGINNSRWKANPYLLQLQVPGKLKALATMQSCTALPVKITLCVVDILKCVTHPLMRTFRWKIRQSSQLINQSSLPVVWAWFVISSSCHNRVHGYRENRYHHHLIVVMQGWILPLGTECS